ncbi:MAG: ABC transporter permease [Anaerolineae bacterium]
MAEATIGQKPSTVVELNKKEAAGAHSLWAIALRRYLKHRMAVAGTLLLITIVAFVIGGSFFFTEAEGNKNNLLKKERAPSSEYYFGTDLVGRDIFVRTIYGGQISIAIGVLSVAISISVGTVVGLLSGYFGGWIDAIFGRITEALLAIPLLILLLVLSTVLSQSTSTVTVLGRELSSTVVVLVMIIGLFSWMQLSRIVRAEVLSLKEREFVLAARALGVSNLRIITRHLLPNLIAPIIVSATLGIGTAIITEAYLSFLGFGVQPPTATWGNILTGAQNRIDTMWWMWMAPGFFIVCTVLAINFIGDGLRDAFDPRSIR